MRTTQRKGNENGAVKYIWGAGRSIHCFVDRVVGFYYYFLRSPCILLHPHLGWIWKQKECAIECLWREYRRGGLHQTTFDEHCDGRLTPTISQLRSPSISGSHWPCHRSQRSSFGSHIRRSHKAKSILEYCCVSFVRRFTFQRAALLSHSELLCAQIFIVFNRSPFVSVKFSFRSVCFFTLPFLFPLIAISLTVRLVCKPSRSIVQKGVRVQIIHGGIQNLPLV